MSCRLFLIFKTMGELFRPDLNKFIVLDSTGNLVRGNFATYKQASNFRNMNNPSWIVSRNPFNRF